MAPVTLSDLSDGVTVRAATLSADGLYRYRLDRSWGTGRPVAWCLVNSSTADHQADDPTIRRCIWFSKREGFGGMVVVNLFAWRSTDPGVLRSMPVHAAEGPCNRAYIEEAIDQSALLVVAWGDTARRLPHLDVAGMASSVGVPVGCLGVTRHGEPRHPLYVPKTQPLVRWPLDADYR